ncbi:glycosyltransferase [Porphyrobacter sp. GA68]|uniref:glycosyltransferase n=1 Tax=Porphyrobacter sp. GA68 TaxID=2883480 RepID=UPI001D1965D6|nr:glycosyltransferase [Porphyrobacter sp. GA68]
MTPKTLLLEGKLLAPGERLDTVCAMDVEAIPAQDQVLAVIVPDLFHATQTFFHEHIANIHPGRTVVVHLSSNSNRALTDVPVLEVPLVPRWPAHRSGLAGKLAGFANNIGTSRLNHQDRQRIASFFKEHGVTHLLAEFATSGVLILPVAERLRLPLTVLSHGWDINILGEGRVWRSRYAKLFGSHAQLAAVCEFLRGRMVRIGASAEKISLIPCAVDAGSFEPVLHGPEPARVVMVCRLIEQKGPLQGLRAFALAHRERPELTLDIVGNGPLNAALLSEIDQLQIGPAVRFHGDLAHRDTLKVVARSHIFIQHCMTLPGKGIESQAISLLEAMGHGLVPIVTRHGGMADHVTNGERGWLVEEGDEAMMARQIVAMADDPVRRQQLGVAARDYVLKFFSRATIYPAMRRTLGLR